MTDKPKITTTDGRDPAEVRREQALEGSTGPQHKSYVVLTPEERAKGFVRPVRFAYIHERCNTETRMGQAIAETYARDPHFYGATYCCCCRGHYPVGAAGEFTWSGSSEKVGT
jgi:hypothetical protein